MRDGEGQLKDDATKGSNIGNPVEETDWTDTLPVTEGTKFFKNIDWSTSTLGLPRTWPATLVFAVRLMFSDGRGACIYWGDERVAIYNEIYQPMAGQAHPKLMGQPFKIGYPELWEGISPIFDQVYATRATTNVENIELFTNRHGYNEETYFIGQFIPIPGDDGVVQGFYNTVYESTANVIETRRRTMITQLAAIPDCDFKQANDLIKQVLQTNGRDMPMTMLFSLDESTSSIAQTLQLRLNIGVQNPYQWVPDSTEIATSDAGIMPYIKTAYEKKTIVVLHADDIMSNQLMPLLEGVDWSGFGEMSKELVISPLISAGNVLGFMVMGSNPRRVFSDLCQQFVADVSLQIAAKWASAFTAEQARAREKRLLLNLDERERRIRYMAESAPVGMLQLTTEGSTAWANQHYLDMITDTSEKRSDEPPFVECFLEDDQPIVRDLWKTLRSGTSANCQARLKTIYQAPISHDWSRISTEPSHTWIWVQGFPLKDDGDLKLVMMCFTDISGPKWAESVQYGLAAAAERAKRQQEEFIDITSHEMRNPLSAIMQSAQSIAASLRSLRPYSDHQQLVESVEEAVEAAETILSCGVYQKRIIDDVLMLSRLENEMLSITPSIVDPVILAQNTLRMLEGDARSGNIETRIVRHESLASLGVGSVLCDPSRLAQILTNLISNAFKFTRNETVRLTEITCGASLQAPQEEDSMRSLQWFTTGTTHTDLTTHPDWGQGEAIYIYFLVRDTGCGLNQTELGNLFTRFSQATTKTHIVYGGSGLGLYISRELTEKHSGQIGVQSEPGKGSTFAFYVKSRRASNASASPSPSPSLPIQLNGETSEMTKLVNDFQRSLQNERRFEILLVEDNPVNQRVLSRQLRKAGCVVHTANDGVEGFESFRKASELVRDQTGAAQPRFDTILMDWNMPNLDGVSCTRRIRSYEVENRIKKPMIIIGITANARHEQLFEAREAGMDVVLSKPFLLADLMAQIQLLVKE